MDSPDQYLDELLLSLVRREFQSAGDAFAAVLAATTEISEAWATLDSSDDETDGRARIRGWLEALWRGVGKISDDFEATSFAISLTPPGLVTVQFEWAAPPKSPFDVG